LQLTGKILLKFDVKSSLLLEYGSKMWTGWATPDQTLKRG